MGAGGSVTAPYPRISASAVPQTVVSETLTDYSIIVGPPTNTNSGGAVSIGRIAIPATSVGEQISVKKTELVNGYYTQWTATVMPGRFREINFFIVEGGGRNLNIEGSLLNYAYEVASSGALAFQTVKRQQPLIEVFDGKQTLTFPVKETASGGVFLGDAQFTFSFSTPIPSLTDRTGDGLIKVRVKDGNGLFSPWYNPQLAANAKITITDGEFYKLDASTSTALDGANTYAWFAQKRAGTYVEITDKVTRISDSDPTIVRVAIKDTPARGDDIVGLRVGVTNSNGLVSQRDAAIFYKPQRGAAHSPSGNLLLAQTVNAGSGETISNNVLVLRLSAPLATAGSSQIADATHPTLFSIQSGGLPTGEIAAFAHDFKNFLWRCWKSDDNAKTWTALSPSFTSPNIDYAHACPLPTGGAAAVAVLKGTPNKLIFKRTGDLDSWPPDSEAVTINNTTGNEPWIVLFSAQGRNEIIVTNGLLTWYKSLDGGRTWSASA